MCCFFSNKKKKEIRNIDKINKIWNAVRTSETLLRSAVEEGLAKGD